ncbi:flagellar hook-associated protein FlgK [Pseudomonas sp. LS1212]|uniref:flagellar hook-associated protein FlgK n=1 Tax=Pseudomonas sp. LS1212 TaxID=2972478 RepID=UPI00215B9E77|nr:flagellar hook-associated protein FlgK [Pseudomonas sp. LS1212]UVJ45415.1 flagellar hook-associated protein FlgK [Pseudomonas sp. LS1212]
MSNLISIGLSGLNASQTALSVTSNNITNVSTSGYSRQQTVTTASPLHNIGVGYIGTGTTLSDVRRIYNDYMDNQLRTSTALNADATAYQAQASGIDKLLSDNSTGISSVLTSFFSALQSASAAPADSATRQLLLTQAQTLTGRFNAISSQMAQQNESINTQLSTLTGQVNKLSSSIASLNQQISAMSASGSTPNSLLDARNEAVRSLNELVGATVQERDGMYDVYLGSGQALVTGVNANTLTAAPSAADKSQYGLTINYQGFSSDVTSVVTGGEIGGLLRYRNDILNPGMNELGRVAMVVSDAINQQLGQGVDANGEFGSLLFSSINSATAITQRSLAASGNSAGSGNLNVTIGDSSKLSTHDYQVKFTSATGYTVTRSDGSAMGSFDLGDNPAPEIDGFTLSLNGGGLSAGDSFKVIPSRAGAGAITSNLTDGNKLGLAGPLTATATGSNTGTSTITQPNLTSKLDIYDSAALAELQGAVENSTPVKLVFGAASGGSQGYTLYNAKGNPIGTGTIVPGQDNKLSINVPMVDASGNPINDAGGVQKTFAFETTIGGTPDSTDSYTIAFNTAGKSDNRNAQELLKLQTAATVGVSNGNAGTSLTGAYASLVETVGAKTAKAAVDVKATSAVVTQAKANRDSVSGVNLDDEAAALVKFQQYYTASSQIIKTAQEAFSTLMNAL